MKTEQKTEFNWLHALEAAVKQEPTYAEYVRLEKLSENWPTCACGELCKDLPRTPSQQPTDQELFTLGRKFMYDVMSRRWPDALATFHAIEQRTAALLLAQGKDGKGSEKS